MQMFTIFSTPTIGQFRYLECKEGKIEFPEYEGKTKMAITTVNTR